jgi:hypothetical protein
MKVIYHYYCKDKYEARQIEQKWIDVFKSTMNSIRAYSKENMDEQLDRELENEINNFSEKLLGCFLYDYYLNLDFEENKEFFCEYCNSTLSTRSNLLFHQKNNKKCLEIQKSKSIETKSDLKECEFCRKNFSSNIIKKHLFTCNIKKEKEYENKISELKKDYENKIFELEKEYEDKIFELKNIIFQKDRYNFDLKELNIKLQVKNIICEKYHFRTI